jgi:hypothetical protein
VWDCPTRSVEGHQQEIDGIINELKREFKAKKEVTADKERSEKSEKKRTSKQEELKNAKKFRTLEMREKTKTIVKAKIDNGTLPVIRVNSIEEAYDVDGEANPLVNAFAQRQHVGQQILMQHKDLMDLLREAFPDIAEIGNMSLFQLRQTNGARHELREIMEFELRQRENASQKRKNELQKRSRPNDE